MGKKIIVNCVGADVDTATQSNINDMAKDFESDLFTLINAYSETGLSKSDTVKRLEWALGSVKTS